MLWIRYISKVKNSCQVMALDNLFFFSLPYFCLFLLPLFFFSTLLLLSTLLLSSTSFTFDIYSLKYYCSLGLIHFIFSVLCPQCWRERTVVRTLWMLCASRLWMPIMSGWVRDCLIGQNIFLTFHRTLIRIISLMIIILSVSKQCLIEDKVARIQKEGVALIFLLLTRLIIQTLI